MKSSLHINLIKREELLSPNPVRLRIMLPLFGVFCVTGLGIWWGLTAMSVYVVEQKLATIQDGINNIQPAHKMVLDLRAETKELSASIQQLEFYKNSRLLFGEPLRQLSAHIPADIQLMELSVAPVTPAKPLPGSKDKKVVVPTNTFESVTMRVAGRAGGEAPSDAINTLLTVLRQPALRHLILSANVPPGAFRQESTQGANSRNTLLFEIMCQCQPRRFE